MKVMKCTNCGAEVPNGGRLCSYCGALVGNQIPAAPPMPAMQTAITNPLMGKKYVFISKRGANMADIVHGKIRSEVEVTDNRLMVNITPQRMNTVPVIFLEDITAIEITKKINAYYWFWIIISLLAALGTSGAALLLTALLVWAGMDRKIRITQRNGKDVIMYSGDKNLAEAFVADMKTITNII